MPAFARPPNLKNRIGMDTAKAQGAALVRAACLGGLAECALVKLRSAQSCFPARA